MTTHLVACGLHSSRRPDGRGLLRLEQFRDRSERFGTPRPNRCGVDASRCGWLGNSLAAVSLLWLSGCGQHDEIARYTVPKLVPLEVGARPAQPALSGMVAPPASSAGPQATLGAIVPLEEAGWFFKLSGPPEAVLRQKQAFDAFIQSLRFSPETNPKPTWTLPEGWEQRPGEGLRYATIRIGTEEPFLELTVIPLPKATGDNQKYLLDNINRWRSQIGLEPIGLGDLADQTQTVTVAGRPVTTVLLVGPGSSSPGGQALGGAGSRVGSSSGGAGREAPGEAPVEYQAPAHWQPSPPSAFSLVAFRVDEGKAKLEITVSTAGGSVLANVNRWRGQVGLPPWTEAELGAAVRKVDTLGTQGDYVELIGPPAAEGGQTILGVIAQAAGQTWFIKLRGDSALAAREKPHFESFVASLKMR